MVNFISSAASPTKEQLLAQLKDIHYPDPVGWWPLAAGWWIIIALLALAFCLLIAQKIYKNIRYRYAKLALKELPNIENNSENWLVELEVLLKRASLCYFNKSQVAKLNGQNWINFLVQTGDNIWSEKSLFTLRDSAFCDPKTIDPIHKAMLLNESRKWLHNLPEVKNLALSEAKHV